MKNDWNPLCASSVRVLTIGSMIFQDLIVFKASIFSAEARKYIRR